MKGTGLRISGCQEARFYIFYGSKSLEKRDTVMRRAIPLEQRVAIALWRLATNGDYRTIAHLFGVSRASVCLIVQDVCDATVQVLLPKYIHTPHGERLQSTVDGVRAFQLAQA